MKRLVALVAVLLAACASLLGPRDIEVPLARLQEGLERRFPFNQRYLGLFDVSAVNPRLALRPDENRIAVTMDLSITPVLALGNGGVRGSLTLSGVPRVDTVRHMLVLGDPRVEDVRFAGLDLAYGGQIAGIATFVAAQLLGDLPVYSFAPDAFRYAGVSFAPVKIVTRPDRLVVTFAPVK